MPVLKLKALRICSLLLAWVLAAFGFSHAHPVCTTLVCETWIDPAPHAYVGIFSGNTVLLGEHPHPPGSIVDFVHALAECSIGPCNPAYYCNFAVVITSGVAVYFGDSHSRWAPGHRQRRGGDDNPKHEASSLHVF